MSDEGSDWSDETDAAPQRVPYGELLDLVHLPSTLKEQLQRNDSQKAFTLNHLALPFIPDAALALDALLADAQALVVAADAIGKTPQREFAHRVFHDLNDGIEGVLTLRSGPVLDACRDLMELTLLFRDFFQEPHRLATWVRADAEGRRRKFSFRFLVNKYKDDLLYVGSNDSTALLREYQAHSRTLHPAMYFALGEELTRGQMNIDSEATAIYLLASHVTELVRHGVPAMTMLAIWLANDNPKHPATEACELQVTDLDSPYDCWMAQWEQMRSTDQPEQEAEYETLLDKDEKGNLRTKGRTKSGEAQANR